MRRMLVVLGLLSVGTVASASRAFAAPAAPLTVFLDRDGESRPAHGSDPAVEIPPYGGGDRAWNAVVDCVRTHYAPFRVDIVDTRPARGKYITAVVGGLASQLGLDDRTTNGVGPFDGSVIPDAVVHVFSQVGTGERDIENVCAVTAHEVGHALGLDHEVLCGDIMSYYLDQCGARRFVDDDAPCGEAEARACGNRARSQNSYRLLAKNVGLRPETAPAAPAAPATPTAPATPYDDDGDDPEAAPPQEPPPPIIVARRGHPDRRDRARTHTRAHHRVWIYVQDQVRN